MSKLKVIIPFMLFFLVLSCTQQQDLIGTWKNDKDQTLVFKKDHSGLWIFESDEKIDTLHLMYKANYDVIPIQLDLYDFETGPLSGLTLYGIVEFQDGGFKYDFEPGDTATVRPIEFSKAKTQTYQKQ